MSKFASPKTAVNQRAPSPVDRVLATPGRPLDASTRAWAEPRLAHDFSKVRIHSGEAAAQAAGTLQAAAFSAGPHIVFNTGRYSPHSEAGRELLAHELVHAAQQQHLSLPPEPSSLPIAPAHAPVETQAWQASHLALAGGFRATPVAPASAPAIHLVPTSLAGIPEAERRAMRVSTMPITISPETIADVFATKGTLTSYGVGGTVSLDPAINAKLHKGLTSIAGYLNNHTNALPLNSTINVALDLTKHGGANSIYRFSWFSHTENKATSDVMVIELVGATPTSATAKVPSGSFKVGTGNFKLSGTWTEAEFGALQHALDLLPASALLEVEGLTFKRLSGVGVGEAGHYDTAKDTVELFDNIFTDSSLRIGAAPDSERMILHEIGHAADLRPMYKAWDTFNSGGQTAKGQTTLLKARSLSGSKWKAEASGDFDHDESLAKPPAGPGQKATPSPKDTAFRKAAVADGVKDDTSGRTTASGKTANLKGGVTDYSDVTFEEMFAEAYALFMADRDRLLALRPKTHAYFLARYP
jgi:hypothetical protein